jgi:hypothetical protein
MYHTIEFGLEVVADVKIPGQARLEQVRIRKGTRLRAEIRPFVLDSKPYPMEMADLFLEDGSAACTIRFASFRFLDE